MKYLYILVIFLFWTDCCVAAGQFYSHLKNGRRATVHHIVPSNELKGRSSGPPEAIFNETMEFNVTLDNNENLTLHLKLNENQVGKILVKVITEHGTEFFDSGKPKDYRFYQVVGSGHGASVMVRCENFKPPCYIAGNFYYKSTEYVIDPDTLTAHNVSTVDHTIYEIEPGNQNPVFKGDEVKVVVESTDQGKRRYYEDVLLNLLKRFRGRKTKRQTTKKTYKIEIEMVADDSLYDFWFNKYSTSDAAIEKLEQYLEQVANNMDLRFSTAKTSTMEIDIVPLSITIITDKAKAVFIADNIVNTEGNGAYHAERALDDLYTWALSNKNPKADALIAFSRRDMWSEGTREGQYTVGIARFPIDENYNPKSGLCTGNAVSLNEDLINGDTSATASHELAHNMGVDHDDVYNKTECDQLFIMSSGLGFVQSASAAKNPWTFSNCSIDEMERLMLELPTDENGKTCLERHTYDVTEYNMIRTSDLLGELYSNNEQCQMLFGQGSSHCTSTSIRENEICWKGLPCSSGGFCEVRAALAGSNCGGENKCYQGVCVAALPAVVTEPVPTVSFSSTSTSPSSTSTSPSSTSTSPSSTSTSPSSTSTSPSSTSTPPSSTSTSTSSTTSSTTSSSTSTTSSSSTTTSTTSSTQSTPTTSTAMSTSPTSTSSTTSTSSYTTYMTTYEEELDFDLLLFEAIHDYCGRDCRCFRYNCWYFDIKQLCKLSMRRCYRGKK